MGKRIGPRMKELCRILDRMGGKAKAQSHVYMQLDYHGHSSNLHGSRVMERTMKAGLIEIDGKYPGIGKPIPVRLTDAGREV